MNPSKPEAESGRSSRLTVRDYPGMRGPKDPAGVARGCFSLEPGQLRYVRGASGSGKSRLLKRIIDLDPEPLGRIQLDGRAVDSIDAASLRRRVCYVAQTPARHPGSVLQFLERMRQFRGNVPYLVDWEAVQAWLHELEVASLLERPMAECSGGEVKRLALVAALQLQPEILLLDEITAGLDAERIAIVERIVAELLGTGSSVLWVSHDEARGNAANSVWIQAC